MTVMVPAWDAVADTTPVETVCDADNDITILEGARVLVDVEDITRDAVWDEDRDAEEIDMVDD